MGKPSAADLSPITPGTHRRGEKTGHTWAGTPERSLGERRERPVSGAARTAGGEAARPRAKETHPPLQPRSPPALPAAPEPPARTRV